MTFLWLKRKRLMTFLVEAKAADDPFFLVETKAADDLFCLKRRRPMTFFLVETKPPTISTPKVSDLINCFGPGAKRTKADDLFFG